MQHRLTRLLLVALAVAALATAGIVANYVLLGYADSRNDPVGTLSPRADITPPRPSTRPRTAEHRPEAKAEQRDD